MKLKLTLMAVAATLALGYQAQADVTPIGTVTNYSKINVGIIVKTNAYSTSGSKEKQTIKSVKIDNKYLLNLFADWYDVENSNEPGTTTWPSGAHLVVGHDEEWDGDVLVVDKTGTNVLYDATVTDGNSSHYFEYYVDYFQDGAYSYDYLNANPGFYSYKDLDSGEAYLYDDDFYLDYTYFWVYYTPFTVNFTEKWGSDGQFTTWSESATFSFTGSDFDFLDEAASTTGTIKESGHGKGYDYYWGAD